ncbi:hypothetical protein LZ30DRAFT_412410 [Colletotrichum cereale]|nr:hypothetical protein LZ30DRAFT_412410 [Colletotrichum cereale]
MPGMDLVPAQSRVLVLRGCSRRFSFRAFQIHTLPPTSTVGATMVCEFREAAGCPLLGAAVMGGEELLPPPGTSSDISIEIQICRVHSRCIHFFYSLQARYLEQHCIYGYCSLAPASSVLGTKLSFDRTTKAGSARTRQMISHVLGHYPTSDPSTTV